MNKAEKEMLEQRTGLRLSTYFSALKIRWLLDNVPAVQQAVEANRCMFGTVDSWFLWVRTRPPSPSNPTNQTVLPTESLSAHCSCHGRDQR